MISQNYKDQVQLLLQILPYVAQEKIFALKGGTAINMFIWNMPRLSVDLDLTYVNFDERDITLANISAAISRIREKLLKMIPSINVVTKGATEDNDEKLICYTKDAQVKIEVNTTMRGIIYPTRLLPIAEATQKTFNSFAEMNIISEGELFGGKICAALDRQHPRDLFDIYNLLQINGFTDEIMKGFIAALLSHPRSIHEMLRPIFYNQELAFNNHFFGMTDKNFSYRDFENTREILLSTVHKLLSDQDKEFLISFKSGNPIWELSGIEKLADLPAVKWKLLNLEKLKNNNADKHEKLIDMLKHSLYS